MLELLFDTSFAASVPRFVTPILLAALGGALCERAGVFNIALEGFLLTGAFAAVLGSYFAGSAYAGALVAILAGIAMGLVFAEFNLRRGGDPIVVSIAVNILAAGLTTYLLRAIFGVSGAFSDPAIVGFGPIDLPGIASIPVIGPIFSGQSILFWVALAAVPAIHVFFRRHRLGLRHAGRPARTRRRWSPAASIRAACSCGRWSAAVRSAGSAAPSCRSPTSICSWKT